MVTVPQYGEVGVGAALVAGQTQTPENIGQIAAAIVSGPSASAYADMSQLYGLVAYAPPQSDRTEVSQVWAMAPYLVGVNNVPDISQLALLEVYRTGVPDARRSRAWWFTLDGHTFYVLDLSTEGTYVYDTTTKQWSRWYTEGFDGMWNMKAGTMWGGLRVVAGDAISGEVWMLDPTQMMDESWRDMTHVVTGGILLRGRVYVGMAALNLSGSVGEVTSDDGTTVMQMRFSDDLGQTWSDYYPMVVTQGDFSDEMAWRSLGSFNDPGRIIEISDSGGIVRIDGLEAQLTGFDNPPEPIGVAGRGR